MRQATCEVCGAHVPLSTCIRVSSSSSSLSVTEKLCCPACAQKEAGPEARLIVAVDPTVCATCKADYGSSELPQVGGLPFCPQCTETLYNRPLPQWLKMAFVATLALLAFALWHGRGYFAAEKELITGERLVEKRGYAESVEHLRAVVAKAPECERCSLLLAKALLLTGEPQDALKTLNAHNGGRFEKNDLSDEVEAIFKRVEHALGKAEEAQKAYKEKRLKDSADLMHQAAREYPEVPALATSAEGLDASVAFEAKDFDKFLAIYEDQWRRNPKSAWALAGMSSGYACKYAVTQNVEFRQKSEELLAQAKDALAASAPKEPEQKEFEAFQERIRYRLETREILGPEEYDAKFHPAKVAAKE